MKALVLAGGRGSRLRPFTHTMPKQLIPVAGRPVLAHVLDDLRGLGVKETAVIVAEEGHDIREALGDGSAFGMRLAYLPQSAPLGLAHCVALAREFLGEDDFVMYLGDNLLADGVAAAAEEFAARRPAAQVVVCKVVDPREFGVAEVDPRGRVERLVEKPRRPRSDLAVTGVYFFTAAVHEAVAAITPSARGELEITDALQWLVAHGHEVRASRYEGFWRDTGRVEDVLDCNRRVLDDLVGSVRGEVDADSRLVGPVVVEEGATVVRSRIEGPAVVGGDCRIEDSRIGPYTSLGQGCELHGAQVTDSILLDRAAVSAVTVRSSLIGHDAEVTCPQVPHPHRIVVGDHSRVEVAFR